jgi:NADH:ubiquinone oxidoreductase subunit 6 (subunit J)
LLAAQLVFLVVGLIVLSSAVLVVTTRNLVHAALWLIVTLFGVAALYAILNAGFIAIVQVVIYIGAIAILFIFAVMLTRKELRDQGAQQNRGWWLGALLALLTFTGLLTLLRGWDGFSRLPTNVPAGFDAVSALGNSLVRPDAFVLPFEVASVLLLAALIGAVYVAFTRR